MKVSCLGLVLLLLWADPSSGQGTAASLGLLSLKQSQDMCKGRIGFIEDPTQLCSPNFYFCLPTGKTPGRAQRFRCDIDKDEVYRVALTSCVLRSEHPACIPAAPPTTQPPPPTTKKIPTCPAGEVYQSCGTACPGTCEEPGPRPCTKQCVRGCFCPPKLVRGPLGTCIPLEWCPKPTTTTTTTTTTRPAEPTTPSCPVGEVYQSCGTACPGTCEEPGPRPCSRQCVRGCFCPPKLVRGPLGTCIPLEWCPKPTTTTTTTTTTTRPAEPTTPSCPLGEVFKTCGSGCEPTCSEQNPVCESSCVSGCFCPTKAVRGPDGFCIPPQWCPEFTTTTVRTTTPKPTPPPLPKCGVNEVGTGCRSECPETCEDRSPVCPRTVCRRGCDCRRGYLRGPRGLCISPKLCPVPTTTTTTTTTTTRPANPTTPPILDCRVLPDGNYEDPRRPCSDEYVACWDGVGTVLRCSPGLAYDVLADRCAPPKLVPWCGGQGTPQTRPPVTRPPLPSNPPKTGTCAGRADGPVPDPSGCARHFFVCVAEEEERMECPGGSYFDEVSGDCLFRQYVRACGGKPTKRPTITTLPPQQPPFLLDCSERKDGDYENPNEACSPLFVSCVAGVGVVRECQNGLAYDVISNKCLEPEYVQWCPGGAATLPTKPTPPPQGNPPPFDFDCWGKEDGFYENPLNPCSTEYVSCVAFEPVFMECPGKLRFDIWSGNCLLEPYIESCGGTPTQTPRPPITQAPPQNPGIVFECVGKADGDYENPLEVCAESYFSCSGGSSTFRVCPAGLKFDVLSGECLEEEYVKWCGGIPTDKPLTTTAPPRNPPFPFDCSVKKDGDYDHPLDSCSPLYVSCSGGETLYRECHSPLVYDWDTGRCLERAFVAGCPGGKPTPPTPHNPPRVPADFDCRGLPDGFYAKSECSESYYACVGEISEEVWCGTGTTFDSDTGDCLRQEHIRGCGGTPTDKTPPPKPSPTVPQEPPAQECLERGPGRYPSEAGCTQSYFVCDEGNLRTEGECSTQTFFDAPSQQCLFKRQVDVCGGGKLKPKPRPPVRPVRPQAPVQPVFPRPEFPTSCIGLDDGFYGRECGVKYVLCSGGRLIPGGTCPSDTRFRVLNAQGTCVPRKLCGL